MSNATIQRIVVGLPAIALLGVTVWCAVAQAGPTPTPTVTPTAAPTPTAVPILPPGSVVSWGENDLGQATPPDAVNGVAGTATDIAAGWAHSCAIQAGTGAVVCWGEPDWADYGQVTPPDAVNGVLGTATDVAAGDLHNCAIQAGTGAVVCWGADWEGQADAARRRQRRFGDRERDRGG